jgi:hypothetical protein
MYFSVSLILHIRHNVYNTCYYQHMILYVLVHYERQCESGSHLQVTSKQGIPLVLYPMLTPCTSQGSTSKSFLSKVPEMCTPNVHLNW